MSLVFVSVLKLFLFEFVEHQIFEMWHLCAVFSKNVLAGAQIDLFPHFFHNSKNKKTAQHKYTTLKAELHKQSYNLN